MAPTYSRASWYIWSILLAYGLLLAYGTLFPLSNWQTPAGNPFQLMLQRDLYNTSRADMLTNILVYMPLGFLLVLASSNIKCRFCKLLLATLVSGLLSLALEYTQAHLPGRVPAISDLILNTAGGFIGAVFGLAMRTDSFVGKYLLQIRQTYFHSGQLTGFGLIVAGLWILSQLSPLVPSIDLGNLKHGIKPLVKTMLNPAGLEWIRVAEYTCAIGALGILNSYLQRIKYNSQLRFFLLVLAVLMLKIPVLGRQLSLEASLGLAAGVVITLLVTNTPRKARFISGCLLLLGFILTTSLYQPPNPSSIAAAPPYSMNMIPFRSHMSNNITGIIDILGGLWPFLLFSYLVIANSKERRIWIAVSGAALIFGLMFTLEWNQQFILGRSSDITDALLPVLGWIVPWLYSPFWSSHPISEEPASTGNYHGNSKLPQVIALLMVAIAAMAIIYAALEDKYAPRTESQAIQKDKRHLPPPEALASLELPNFNYLHPRLPAPSTQEIIYLKRHNPDFFEYHRKLAAKDKGKLYSAILMAYVEPGSVNLDQLFERLVELRMSSRGHDQAKPLALAYDWLYDQWNRQQLTQLRDKVLEATDYLIHRIRVKQQLSPYNVFLYNSPLQALMATSISSFGDSPRADMHMRWTTDYWKNRVLPVWRQVMGKNGGWHEGGEYVGIGIGNAIYQLPAMWRKATGEDLFRTEPGIRGFLDFLVYRTRPDNTHTRWGDGRFYDKASPDRSALAIEYGQKAAYSLGKCPQPDVPTSWPWGPLTSSNLCDAGAIAKFQLQNHFDGIGLIVARSSWNRDATYLTFKAGDNYWSHSHLDQGAFTLYKKAPLAIDSGLYGPSYGSDHHMNYSYQSIAHNVITVTDPNDNIPVSPRKKEQPPRKIANDGGQRRVGSGWGVDKGPLDISEWQKKSETFHTGKILRYHDRDNLVIAVSNLTPAYTNRLSGTGTFSHRTRRVDRYLRTIVYDRSNDILIVHDDVTSTKPEFQKRSLIHTIDQPEITPTGFTVKNSQQNGGGMSATVLYPMQPVINIIGGNGKEFFVDGSNYDENGKVWKMVGRYQSNMPEPGSWRVEISPADQNHRNQFLVILNPAGNINSEIQITRLDSDNHIGAEIKGTSRMMKAVYPDERDGVEIEIYDKDSTRRLDLTTERLEKFAQIKTNKKIWDRIMELMD